MLYKSSYNDVKMLAMQTHYQKSDHVAFRKFKRPKFKESGYTNRQFQPTLYFRNTSGIY